MNSEKFFLGHLHNTKPYVSQHSEENRAKIRLNQNESLLPFPAELLNKCMLEVSKYSHFYPDPNCTTIVNEYARLKGLSSEEIIVTNGSNQGLEIVARGLLEDRTEIIIDSPTYEVMRMEAEIQKANIKQVVSDHFFDDDVNHIMESISSPTRVVYMANPGNPSGKLYSRDSVLRVLRKDVMLVLDEAYVDFAPQSLISLIREYDNLIVLRTLSKAFSAAGLRIGFILSQGKNISLLKKLIPPWSVNHFTQVLGTQILTNTDLFADYINEVKRVKQFVKDELNRRGIEVQPTYTNFILAKFDDPHSIATALKERGILVSVKTDLPKLRGYIRITLGTMEIAGKLIYALDEIAPH